MKVAIVGDGPVGVIASIFAASRGLEAVVIEKNTEVYNLPRAITMDDEIQRLFQSVGLTDGLRAITTPLLGAEFVTPNGERIIGVDFPADFTTPAGHPPAVAYYQPELEAFLRNAAIDLGVDLRLGHAVTGLSQQADTVRVDIDGQTAIEADFAIAADGASSPTRKALGIPFVDQGFDQDWLVADFKLNRPLESLPPFVQQICDPQRPTTFVPGHADYRRWEFQLQASDDRDAIASDDAVWDLVAPWLTQADAQLIRSVVYRFHATVAEPMQSGRIFLAGDAAHQMPPFLGQGLATGIRDGFDLAWKIALVDRQLVSPRILDTYASERAPYARSVVENAVETGRLIDELAQRTQDDQRDLNAGYGGSRGRPKIGEGLLFGEHRSVGRQVPQIGPLDDGLGPFFSLLTLDTSPSVALPAPWDQITAQVSLTSATLSEELLPSGGVVLVRPDRVIAAVGSVDAVIAGLVEFEAQAGLAPDHS